MRTITGSYYWNDDEDTPAANATLTLQLSQDVRAVEGGVRLEGGEGSAPIEIQLDEKGSIPEGTQIPANDELKPEGTFYTVRLIDPADNQWPHFIHDMYIVGPEPIDISSLPCEASRPHPVPVEPEAKPKRMAPIRKAGTSYGFFGGTVHAPAVVGSTSILKDIFKGNSIDGLFGVLAFSLPMKALVNCASIYVDTPGNDVIVGLYDADRNKRCETVIEASKTGIATGDFRSTVNLNPGDYYFAFGIAQANGVTIHSVGENHASQCALMNEEGGAVLAGIAHGRQGKTLPQKARRHYSTIFVRATHLL
jgi:hypothetical protein